MRGAPSPSPEPVGDRAATHRDRILTGLATALAEKGYAATTIADIAAAARVSRTTVYAEFADKDQALIALYASLTDRMLGELERTLPLLEPTLSWQDKVRALADAYLDAIAAATEGERLSLLEIASAGPAARAERREILGGFWSTVDRISGRLQDEHDGVRALGEPLAVCVVGAVNELVLHAADDGPDAVRALGPTVTTMIVRLMVLPPGSSD